MVIVVVLVILLGILMYFRATSEFKAANSDYSLGNIIGESYGDNDSHATDLAGNHYHLFGIFFAKSHDDLFGKFFENRKKLTRDLERFWWDSNDNYVKIHPEFTEYLRSEINEYKGWKIPSQPTTPKTCVIHFRVGDFLSAGSTRVFDSEILVNALSKLPTEPDRFELLNGGIFHTNSGINEDRNKKSMELLEKLKSQIKDKFPNVEIVEIDDSTPDNDFYRMVNAPMLVTGLGSFATMAAAANKNFRLTPEFTIRDPIHKRDKRPPRNMFENWYTYI